MPRTNTANTAIPTMFWWLLGVIATCLIAMISWWGASTTASNEKVHTILFQTNVKTEARLDALERDRLNSLERDLAVLKRDIAAIQERRRNAAATTNR